MPRRSGATLIEVLVAIFVMGIGLLALLTLFPLGALTMAQAIQNDRCVQAGVSATDIAAARNLRNDPNVTEALMGRFQGVQDVPQPPADARSYPVFVDPIGFAMAIPPNHKKVAGLDQFRRVYPTFIDPNPNDAILPNPANPQHVFPWFMLLDELVFDTANATDPLAGPPWGTPKQLVAGVVERDPRYSWAYLVQRPRSADPSVVEMAVVVYSGRPLSLTNTLSLSETLYSGYNNALPLPEVAYDAASSRIRVRWEFFNNVEPQVRAGNWVLDVSTVRNQTRAYFYRVAGVTEGTEELPAASGTFYKFVDIETQQPLRDVPAGTFSGTPNANYPNDRARMIVMEGVAEVFERGLGRQP